MNIQLNALPLRTFEPDSRLKNILEISRLFKQVNPETVKAEINHGWNAAEFPPVTDGEIKEALRVCRAEIQQTVSDKLSALTHNEYIELMSALTEKYASDDDRYSSAAVIEDILSDYEPSIQTRSRCRHFAPAA